MEFYVVYFGVESLDEPQLSEGSLGMFNIHTNKGSTEGEIFKDFEVATNLREVLKDIDGGVKLKKVTIEDV